jgi:hypothetical protein
MVWNLTHGKTARVKTHRIAGHQWLTPIILATQEAEIRRITVQNHPGQIVQETLSQKKPSQKRAGGVAQGEGPESKPQYCKKTNKKKTDRVNWINPGEVWASLF